MANFLRQKYKEKPQAWGSFDSVQRSLFKNAERIGIDSDDIAFSMPCWTPINYANNIQKTSITTGINFVKNTLRSTNVSGGIIYPNSTNLNIGLKDFSVVCNIRRAFNTYTLKTILAKSKYGEANDRYGLIFETPYIVSFYCNNVGTQRAVKTNHFTDTTKDHSIISTIKRNGLMSLYLDGKIKHSIDVSSDVSQNITSTLSLIVSGYNNIEGTGIQKDASWLGDINNVIIIHQCLSQSQTYLLSDNPYQLWQRQPDVFFSIPVAAGGTTYQATCEDILNISSSIAKQATFSASCIESVNLTGADGNNAMFQASTIDNINFQELASTICNFTALISSQFSFSDSNSLGTTLQAILSDSISLADSNTAIATLTANISDSLTISEIISVLMSTSATSSDSISIADYSALGTMIVAIVSEEISISDINSIIASLKSETVDSITLSNIATAIGNYNKNANDSISINDLISIIGNFGVSLSETINFADIVDWGAVKSAIAESGISISDSNLGTLLFYASIADSISISDNNSVNITYNVSVSDVLSFSDTVSKIAMLRAIVAEQFNINDIAMEVSQLPNGKCSVTFTMKIPGAVITQSTGSIGCNIKTATITFNLI